MKRTDFLVVVVVVDVVAFAEVVLSAWTKSSARDGSLGCVRVAVVPGEEKPWNCEVRSSSCFCRLGRASAIVAALL